MIEHNTTENTKQDQLLFITRMARIEPLLGPALTLTRTSQRYAQATDSRSRDTASAGHSLSKNKSGFLNDLFDNVWIAWTCILYYK